jgi:outer membrane protein
VCRSPVLLCLLGLGILPGLPSLGQTAPEPPTLPAGPGDPADPDGGLRLLEAVRLMLDHDPNVALAESFRETARGSLLVASGRFDPVVGADLTALDVETPLAGGGVAEVETVGAGVGVDTELRTGTVLSPRIDVNRDEIDGPGAEHQGVVAFTVRQPLLRDRGRRAVAAGERAARRELTAADLDLTHTVSQRVERVVSAYWQYRAAYQNLEIFRVSETRSRDLLATTRRLIEADRVPAADLLQLQADLASKETSRIRGEQDLYAARQDLGREIGLSYEEVSRLPPPLEPFPLVAPAETPPPELAEGYLAAALGDRADLAAARQRLEASRDLRRAAENGLLPRLDLVVTPSYAGRAGGTGLGPFAEALLEDVPGLSATAGLALTWPTLNRAARGRLVQAEAAETADAARLTLVVNDVATRLPTALDALAGTVQELERAEAAVRLFEQTADNEVKKLRAGASTLLDVITQQDRLTSARQSVVSARLRVALALVDLRFETGTLVTWTDPGYRLEETALVTVPPMPAPPFALAPLGPTPEAP